MSFGNSIAEASTANSMVKTVIAPSETLITDLPRLQYVFRPTGAVFGDSVLVRGFGATVMIMMDEWSGQAVVHAR